MKAHSKSRLSKVAPSVAAAVLVFAGLAFHSSSPLPGKMENVAVCLEVGSWDSVTPDPVDEDLRAVTVSSTFFAASLDWSRPASHDERPVFFRSGYASHASRAPPIFPV